MNLAKKFPNLHTLFGSCFNQDWMEDYDNESDLIMDFVARNKLDVSQHTLHELDQLISMDFPEDELNKVMENVLSCDYDPDGITMTKWLHWVRDTMAKYAADKSAEEKKSQC